jgi:hypothetical protein
MLTYLINGPILEVLTVTRTCQWQQLNALVYLTAAIRAHRRRQVAASLLSKSATPELLRLSRLAIVAFNKTPR